MDKATSKGTLKADLFEAIKQNQLLLHYQPQINIATSQIESLEALVRWQHPVLGLLFPADFLMVAEETGLIVKIGEWVIETACKQNKAWQDKGLPPVRVAVNVSPRQFQQKEFVESVMKVLTKCRLKPKFLELELTENMILQDTDKVIQRIHRLKKLGVSIALDDFGTGYSSISYLRLIPVDRIKIDKTFISNITKNEADKAIVNAIIMLAKGLHLQVLAEGVESYNQLCSLAEIECQEIQGFYFSEPLAVTEVERFMINFRNNNQ